MTAQCCVASGRPKILRQTSRLSTVTYRLITYLWFMIHLLKFNIARILLKYTDVSKHLV